MHIYGILTDGTDKPTCRVGREAQRNTAGHRGGEEGDQMERAALKHTHE